MVDIFERIRKNRGPIGKYEKEGHGYYAFPKLEGEIGPHMIFRGKPVLNWSLNNYIGLANHPEVRKADADAAAVYGMAYPMGARMMSGQTTKHEELEQRLAQFEKKEDAYLLNFGYQGMVSIIDCLAGRNDVVVYDSEAHACIIDGLRLSPAKRFVYGHNDMDSLEKQLQHATSYADKTGGGILVITEGVFGMAGDLGYIPGIVEKKARFSFRLLVDDAHGFGTMGKTGAGIGEHFNAQDQIDLYFSTFAKSMAGIGGFVAGDADIINFLRYNLRSQIFAKSLPMPMVFGALKRLDLLQTRPELKNNLWEIVGALQSGLKKEGFDIGVTQSPVTPVYMHGEVPEATNLVLDLRENYGIFCSIVVYPVIPKGQILLRLIPTAVHTHEDVERTIKAFSACREKLAAGKYVGEAVVQPK
ncbi:aminotransferase class I/II-fold pyridoxal phosphate-dependent enzyme [uncultured Acetobacteroides sp.]|uniref:aminotransferase class I/II-fold pyridoxal phosphate-dependent enzyme n=1 Tax=uncultured Acetobacteroides sp. TaxID=1760811 RepID=UPI0029F4A14F|nr:aminotransferase class I/II-fold pyridoxal phosphate-dependent enzyme [uncultured Acetobacteroides sp.]